MSGIAGIFYPDGRPAARERLGAMTAALAHRGPDAEGRWQEGGVALGHRMLHTTPESLRERQPLAAPDDAFVVTADARVDNRTELLAALGLNGQGADAPTDVDLILAAYRKWGEDCAAHLIGDFAFAVWDARRRRLFLARDPMGVRPLFYHHAPGRAFVFGSEIKALFREPDVPRRISDARIAQFLTGVTAEDAGSTYYEHVRQVPPAHTAVVDEDGLRLRRYWALDPERELHLPSDEAYAEAFRELFLEAVRCRVRSAFPVASSLSGGLDSSSVACAARNVLQERGAPLHTFSGIFPSFEDDELRAIDERHYMERVAATGGIVPHYLRVDECSPLEDVETMLWHQDEAFWAPNLYLHWRMYRGAQEAGARVFLDGLDGDSVVSHGLARFGELVFAGAWEVFGAEIRAMAARRNLSHHHLLRRFAYPGLAALARRGRWIAFLRGARYLHRAFGVSRRTLYVEQGLARLMPEGVRWGRGAPEPAPPVLVHPDLVRRTRLQAAGFEPVKHSLTRTHREAHLLTLNAPALPETLGLADRATAACGLEGRYPFFDRRLMEFSVALPAAQKLHDGWTRGVFRRAMEGVLPPEVQWRPDKANLGRNFERNLFTHEAERLAAVVRDEAGVLDGYVDKRVLRTFYERCRASAGTPGDYMGLYTGVMLWLWLRHEAAPIAAS